MFHINGESLDQTQRRECQVLDNFSAEKDLLTLRAGSNDGKCKQIDKEIPSLFSENAAGRIKDKLLELWVIDTKRGINFKSLVGQ